MNENAAPLPEAGTVVADPPDWVERARQCRAEEWALANELLGLGRRLLWRHITEMRGNVSLTQVEKVLQLATKLARISTDVGKNPDADTECRECCAARRQMEASIKRIYGEAAERRAEAGGINHQPSTIN